MTGIGLMFAEAVLSVASSNLWLALIFVMLSCLVMGMGVPSGAAYLMIAIVLGPVLQKLGLSLMAAHLFVVYFGALSVVTPPVALAAFAAAPIAEANPMETGLQATRLAIAGFIIPYLFVFHPDILLVVGDFNFGGLLWALFIFLVSTWGIATAIWGLGTEQIAPLAERDAAVGGSFVDCSGSAFRTGGRGAAGGMSDIEFADQFVSCNKYQYKHKRRDSMNGKKFISQLVLTGALLLAMVTMAQAGKTLKMATIAPGSSAYLTMTTMATMINQAQNEPGDQSRCHRRRHQTYDRPGQRQNRHLHELNPQIYFLMKNQKAMYKKLENAPALPRTSDFSSGSPMANIIS